MSTTPQTWTRTNQIYGQLIGISELAHANGTYLAHCENHPNGTSCFETVIISTDLVNWQHRESSPKLDYTVSDLKFMSCGDYFIAAANGNNKLIVFTSVNGFDWHIIYESDESYTPISINYVNGVILITCIGCMFVSSEGKTWNKLSLPVTYNTATIVGSAMGIDGIYFLLKSDNVSYIAMTVDGNTFKVMRTPWSMESVAIFGNGQQVVVSARIKNKACLIYFIDDIEAYEIHSIPEQPFDNNFLTVKDMLWHNNEWTIVCSREFYNSGGLLFSAGAYLYRNAGLLTTDSHLVQDTIEAKNLTNIKLLNNQLVAFGNAFPNPDNCLYVVAE